MRLKSPSTLALLPTLGFCSDILPDDNFAALSREHNLDSQFPLSGGAPRVDSVPLSTREHWMRRAKAALKDITGTPCPVQAFGTAIVNHTSRAEDDVGTLICLGANQVMQVGNPTLHGEVAAINNCTAILSNAPHNLSPAEINAAWRDLSLYTTAEACTMCTSAIRWGVFREYAYATSVWRLIELGWSQVPLGSADLLSRDGRGRRVRVVEHVLADETDELFRWQFSSHHDGECPEGCQRGGEGEPKCVVTT